MDLGDSIADLQDRLGNNDPQAAAEVFHRYVEKLIRVASPRLIGAIRQKFDPEDLVQSAFGSFFRRNSQEPFSFDSWESLGALLATITIRKCCYRVRQYSTSKRHFKKEEHLDQLAQHEGHSSLCSAEPTPLEAATFEDLVTELLKGLEGKTVQICELALLGFSPNEVASQVGLTERSVFRQMERIRAKLYAMNQDTVDNIDIHETLPGNRPHHEAVAPTVAECC